NHETADVDEIFEMFTVMIGIDVENEYIGARFAVSVVDDVAGRVDNRGPHSNAQTSIIDPLAEASGRDVVAEDDALTVVTRMQRGLQNRECGLVVGRVNVDDDGVEALRAHSTNPSRFERSGGGRRGHQVPRSALHTT